MVTEKDSEESFSFRAKTPSAHLAIGIKSKTQRNASILNFNPKKQATREEHLILSQTALVNTQRGRSQLRSTINKFFAPPPGILDENTLLSTNKSSLFNATGKLDTRSGADLIGGHRSQMASRGAARQSAMRGGTLNQTMHSLFSK